VKIWEGGMAFHGGLLGVGVATALFARSRGRNVGDVFDFTAPLPGVGLFCGRIGNFINGELWGRPTDVPWAMIFPGAPDALPRHPSQIYEAVLEGLLVFVVLTTAARGGALCRPGLIAGGFGVLYGLARIASEFFRDPDPVLEDLGGGLTMGMALSAPMVAIGLGLIACSLRVREAPA
jgi:phosphatidylglycerol:prolipoprotein diacylglycerol transferase